MRNRNNRGKIRRRLPNQKEILRCCRYTHNISKKFGRTLAHCSPAWLDDIILVTWGSKQDHERKLFEILNKLEKSGYRASKRKSEFFTGAINYKTREVIQLLSSNFNLYGLPGKIRSDKGSAFLSKDNREFCKNRNKEIEYCTGNGAVEKATQTINKLLKTNMEDRNESVNRALRVMRFTVHTGLKKILFELHHGRKP